MKNTNYCNEFKQLFHLAWPMMLTQMLQYLPQPLAVMFCGRLGETQLSAVGLANSLINVTGVSIASGLSTACDTLFAQTYGCGEKATMGVILQRSLLIIVLGVFPCWTIHINTESLLLLVGQDAEVARMAGRYMELFMPGLLSFFLSLPLIKFVQNQNAVLATMLIGIGPCVVSGVAHYVLIIAYPMDIDGSAIAQALAYGSSLPFSIILVCVTKTYKETWSGWSWECLNNWGGFLRLSLAGLLMICMEWWLMEVGTFLSGLFSTVELGAQSIVLQFYVICYLIPLGIGMATSIRVGQFLGQGLPDRAKLAYRMSLVTVLVLCVTISATVIGLRNFLPAIFTSLQNVEDLTSHLLLFFAIFIFFNGISAATSGMLRGCGMLTLGAKVIVASMLFVGLPAGICLMFLTDLRISGLWLGYAMAQMFAAFLFILILARTDWHHVSKAARRRVLGSTCVEPTEKTPLLIQQKQITIEKPTDEPIEEDATVSLAEEVYTIDITDGGNHDNKPTPTRLILKVGCIYGAMLALFFAGILVRIFYKP